MSEVLESAMSEAYSLPESLASSIKATFKAHLSAGKAGVKSTVSQADEIRNATPEMRSVIATAIFEVYRRSYIEAEALLTKAEKSLAGNAWNECRKNLDGNLETRFLKIEWPRIKYGTRADGSAGCVVHDLSSWVKQKADEKKSLADEKAKIVAEAQNERVQEELTMWRGKTPEEAATTILGMLKQYGTHNQQVMIMASLNALFAGDVVPLPAVPELDMALVTMYESELYADTTTDDRRIELNSIMPIPVRNEIHRRQDERKAQSRKSAPKDKVA